MEHQTTQQNGSAEHLFDASSLRYLRELRAEALQHEAVHHPYLAALREGTMRDPQEALRDFAREYQGYSAWFPRFLAAVDERLPQELRSILDENKAEESGCYDEETLLELEAAGLQREWVDRVPHPELFRRFQRALTVEPDAAISPEAPVSRWRQELLTLLQNDHPAAAIGALGLGTELVVSHMYASVLEGVDRFSKICPEGRSFLVLHALVDDAHAESLLRLAQRFAMDGEGRAALARGMRAALDMRAEFWDELLERGSASKEDAA